MKETKVTGIHIRVAGDSSEQPIPCYGGEQITPSQLRAMERRLPRSTQAHRPLTTAAGTPFPTDCSSRTK